MTKDDAINILQKYLYEKYSPFEERAWPARLREYDENPTKLLSRIFYELDCTRKMPDGITPIVSTNSLVYRCSISEALWVIELMDNADEMYDKLIEIHNSNLEYEAVNPPPVYKNNKKGNKVSKTKSQKTLFDDDVKPKINKTSKTKSEKIPNNLLKFNLNFIKP